MKIILKKDITNFVFVFILIAMSGFPFFYMDPLFRPLLIISTICALLVFINRGKKFNTFILKYFLIFFLIIFGQVIVFSFFPIATVFGYSLRILLAYFVIIITGVKFIDYYIKILYVFCIISFFFFFPTVISPNFEYYFTTHITPIFNLPQDPLSFYQITPNVIVFNFNSLLGNSNSEFVRNSGPFWEPGAFAGFAIISLMFNIIKTNKLFNRTNIVFIIAIITTFSTAGYVALLLILISYYLQNAKGSYKYFILPAIIFISYYAYYNLDFLNSKIDNSIQTIGTSNTSNRFVSALTDIEDVKKYWLFGRGFNVETRFDKSVTEGIEMHRNNGITGLLVNIGLLPTILYFFLIYKFFKRFCIAKGINQFSAFTSTIIILTIGFSEGYFTKVFFIALTMLFFVVNDKRHKIIETLDITTS